jgi:hypothetical protein
MIFFPDSAKADFAMRLRSDTRAYASPVRSEAHTGSRVAAIQASNPYRPLGRPSGVRGGRPGDLLPRKQRAGYRGHGDPALLRAALEMAGRGWHVFPCAAGTKRPALSGNWQPLATTDPGRIRDWWACCPYNIGISCGPSGQPGGRHAGDCHATRHPLPWNGTSAITVTCPNASGKDGLAVGQTGDGGTEEA